MSQDTDAQKNRQANEGVELTDFGADAVLPGMAGWVV
jgi:hypothetical protein